MPHGYNGKILRVDLSRGVISVDEPDEDFYRCYIGGRGFISYFLLRELGGDEDALGPENQGGAHRVDAHLAQCVAFRGSQGGDDFCHDGFPYASSPCRMSSFSADQICS